MKNDRQMKALDSLPQHLRSQLLDGVAKIAQAFWGPERERCRLIRQHDYLAPFEALAEVIRYEPPDVVAVLRRVVGGQPDAAALFDHLEHSYVSLFINSRQGRIAPLYASCYEGTDQSGGNELLMGPAAMDMQRRIEQKGLGLTTRANEPPDHIAVELEYLYFLLSNGWAANQGPLLAEAQVFAGEVMLPWVSRLRDRIDDDAHERFYPLLAGLAVSILAHLGGVHS